jgi:hypothetical protein
MKGDLALQQQMLVNYLLHQVNLNFLGLHVALHAIPSCTYWGFFFRYHLFLLSFHFFVQMGNGWWVPIHRLRYAGFSALIFPSCCKHCGTHTDNTMCSGKKYLSGWIKNSLSKLMFQHFPNRKFCGIIYFDLWSSWAHLNWTFNMSQIGAPWTFLKWQTQLVGRKSFF